MHDPGACTPGARVVITDSFGDTDSRFFTHSHPLFTCSLSCYLSLSLSLSLHCRLLKQILALFEPLIEAAIEAAEMLANGLENAVGGIIDKVPGLKSLGSMFGM